jgi:tetratricopeptide (TPR) repeat protein
MRKFLFAVFGGCIFFISCGSPDATDGLLKEPPYDKLTDSIRQAPGNADLYYKRGVLLYQNEKNGYAEKDIRTAWQMAPNEEYALGLTRMLKEKDTDSAIAFLQEAIKKIPGSISLQISLARGYQQKNKMIEAMAIAQKMIGEHPENLDAAELQYDLLLAAGRESEAITFLEKAYALAPSDVALSEKLLFAYAESKNAKALALADSLISVDANHRHAEPYFAKGVYYSNTGNHAAAIQQFDEAIQHDYLYLPAYINKGIVYYEQKKYQEALKTFDLAMRVDPSYADSYYWNGKTHESMGNKEEARLNYRKAYQLDKTMEEARKAAERISNEK